MYDAPLTNVDTLNPWFQIDLVQVYDIWGVTLYVRDGFDYRMAGVELRVGNTDATSTPPDDMIV